MWKTEVKLLIADVLAVIGMFYIGGYAGMKLSVYFKDPIIGFNLPAISVLVAGTLFWRKIRRHI